MIWAFILYIGYLVNQSSPIPTGSRYYVLEVELVEEGGVSTSQDDVMGEANSRGLASSLQSSKQSPLRPISSKRHVQAERPL